MAEENTEVDIEAILARLNGENAENLEAEDTSDALEENHEITAPQTLEEEKQNSKKDENLEPLKEEEQKTAINIHIQQKNEDNTFNSDIQKEIAPEIQKSENSELKEIRTQSTSAENLHLPDHIPEKTQKSEDDDDYVSPEHESLLERIQKIKQQIFESKHEEDLVNEHSFQMLDQQSKNVHLSGSILSTTGLRQEAIDHKLLEDIIEAVKSIHANNLSRIIQKQTNMYGQMAQIKSLSDHVAQIYENRRLDFAKTQTSVTEKALNEVMVLERSCEKTNEALWFTVDRLKEIELELDSRLNQKKPPSLNKT